MTDPINTDSSDTRSTAAIASARPRWPRRLAMLSAAVAIVLVLSIFVAPRYIARYLLAAQFDALDIAHEGLHTLELELLRGRVAIGPVALGVGQQPPARLARFEGFVDLAALFAGRLSIENVTVQGIELQIPSTVDGEMSVNGMRVATLPGIALAPGLLHAEILGLPVGLESVELTDSHLRVQTPWGGHLDIALQRLALSGFRGWQAEQATSFQIEARINDMPLRLNGDATPLLAEPSLRIETFVDEMTVERIARLTNAAKLDRAKGRYSIHSNHELSMARSGELSGRSKGKLTLTGADYLVPGLIEASANRLQVGFETDYRFPAAGGWQLSGRADLSLDEARLSGPEQAHIEVRALRWQVSDVQSASDVAGNGHLQLTSELQADDAALRGQLRLSVQMIIYLLRALQFLTAGADMNTSAAGIDSWAGHEIRLPATNLAIARLHFKSERLEVTTGDQGVTLTLDNVAEATAIHAQSGGAITDAESLRLAITKFRLTQSPQGTSIDGGLSAQALSVKVAGNNGEGSLDTIDAAIETMEIKVAPESLSMRLDGHAGVTRLNATEKKDEQGFPATKFALAGGAVTVRQASLSATANTMNWKLEGDVQTSEMDFTVGEPNVARGAVGRMDVTGIQIDETNTVVTDSIELQGVDVAMLGSHLLRELASDVAEAGSAARARPDAKPDAKPDAIGKSGGRAPVPHTLAGAKAADADVSLERVQRALLEHGFDPGPLDGIMGRQTVAAIKAFQASNDLAVDGNLSKPLLRTLGLLRPGAADRAQAPTEPGPPIRFKLNSMQFTKGAKLHFSDDTAEPDVDVRLVFDTLSVRNLDTADPDQRLQVHASATVNEFSQAEIRGWLAPLRDPLDLDLKIVLQDVELSPFASYTDYYLGLSIDEGQLSTVSTFAVQDGALDVQLELDIWRLHVRPLSEEDEQKIADALGISVVTAIRLVKDAGGGIELSIPIAGTVDEPQVDASDGVNKAIGSVVISLLPTTWIADLFSSHGDVDIEPVVFAAGSSELSESGRQNLDLLAEAMQQHPDAVITVCGRATGADNPVLRSQGALDDTMALAGDSLAVRRTRSVRRHLVREKDLPARRVTECRAAYSQSDPKPPRVKISL